MTTIEARPWLAGAAFAAATAGTAVVGSLAAVSAREDYAALQLPSWAPPGWLFGPVWTVLYVMIAIAGWLVWQRVGWGRELAVYAAQLVANAIWTPLFFGARAYGLALVDIVLLLGLVVATIVLFVRRRPVAGWLLVPYAAWVAFATALNAAVWSLN